MKNPFSTDTYLCRRHIIAAVPVTLNAIRSGVWASLSVSRITSVRPTDCKECGKPAVFCLSLTPPEGDLP